MDTISDYYKKEDEKEKEVLVYDNLYGYGIYKIIRTKSNGGQFKVSTEKGKVTGVEAGDTSVEFEDGKVKSADTKASVSAEHKNDKGVAVGSSTGLAVGTSGPKVNHSVKVSNDGTTTTTDLEAGVKERNGRVATYQKSTTSVEREAEENGKTVTRSVISSYETGQYIANSQVGQEVHTFDWGEVAQPVVNTVGTVVGGVTDAVGGAVDFVASHPKEVLGTVALGVIATAGFFTGQWQVSALALMAMPTLYVGDDNQKGGL